MPKNTDFEFYNGKYDKPEPVVTPKTDDREGDYRGRDMLGLLVIVVFVLAFMFVNANVLFP